MCVCVYVCVYVDNMSIIGVTIDYGPFGFIDAYNPDHVCNGSDDSGRYAYRFVRTHTVTH